MHSQSMFMLPVFQCQSMYGRYAGYLTCFRKEAVQQERTHGAYQFEKVEQVSGVLADYLSSFLQFLITSPKDSWAEFEDMVTTSEEFFRAQKFHINWSLSCQGH